MDPITICPSELSLYLLPSINEGFFNEGYENYQQYDSLPKFQSPASPDRNDIFTYDDGTLNYECPTPNCLSKDIDNSSTTSSDTDSSTSIPSDDVYSSCASCYSDLDYNLTTQEVMEEEEENGWGIGRDLREKYNLARWSYRLRTTLKIRGKMSDSNIEKVQLCLTELESITPIALSIEDSDVLRHLKAVLKRKEIPMDEEFQISKRISNLWEKFHNILKCQPWPTPMAKAQCQKQNQPVIIDLTSDREEVDKKVIRKRKRCTELATTTTRRLSRRRIAVPDYMDMEHGWIQTTLKTMKEIIDNNHDIGETVKVEKKSIMKLVRNLEEYENIFLQVSDKWEKTR